MEYRRLPKGIEEISVIGFGGSGLHQAGEKAGAETVLAAIEHGVNYFDMAVSEAAAFKSYRAAFAGRRDQVYLQMHFGADYSSGQYGWTTDVGRIRQGMDWLLRKLDTDYIDFGFIHCIDQAADLEKYINSGALAHIQKLKEEGVVNPRLQDEVRPGDVVQAGVSISNSETGRGAVSVCPLVYRLACTNGMTATDSTVPKMRRTHSGPRILTNKQFFACAAEVLTDSDQDFVHNLQAAVREAMDETRFVQLLNQMRESAQLALNIDNLEEVVKRAAECVHITETESVGILRHLHMEGDYTLYGLANAVTRYSQDVDSVFLKDGRCSIYEARPRVCRLYPFNAFPGQRGKAFAFYQSMDQHSSHYAEGKVSVKDWMYQNFKREDREFLTLERPTLLKLGRLLRALSPEHLKENLFQIIYYRYYNYGLDQPFVLQYEKNTARLESILQNILGR